VLLHPCFLKKDQFSGIITTLKILGSFSQRLMSLWLKLSPDAYGRGADRIVGFGRAG
jgi:hypothetical protein